ncbi:lycopene cyclase family protein [Kineococcus rhizosphaerae]|uniref:Lycopene beta-cyclase n=1 Tax=Kineococcus rhizosphaerae TaxID=559628 RepID=A0A2T0QZL3_9ACTN|nr:lycopene cyclase family protein [Kineococcus rhizosphaerae]PRY12127.1 lycopene beta-cyclase [Kineococcus rhizosphaerae]
MLNPRPRDHGRARITLVGLGAAGASLAWRLLDAGIPFEVVEAPAGAAERSPERTWSTWGAAGPGPFGHLVRASWPRVRVVGTDGATVTADLGGWRYRSLHSTDLDRAVRERLARAGVPVHERVLTGRPPVPAVDTRPVPVPTTGRTLLWQHFLGHRVRTARPAFDVRTATLMDFRTPQPAGGVAFGYVLPTSATEALVEYTEFSPGLLTPGQYAARLREYLQRSGIGTHEVLGVETGVIPMTDAAFPASEPGVLRWGAGAGSIRPSTGYSFSTLQRQADAIVARWPDLRLPPPHRRRHLLMDSLVLRGMAEGRLGARFFVDLFARNPVQRVLGFLDGTTSPAQDLALMATSPRADMLALALAHSLPRSRGPAA